MLLFVAALKNISLVLKDSNTLILLESNFVNFPNKNFINYLKLNP